MPTEPTTPAAPPPSGPRPEVDIRPARWRDLPTLVRLYRSQPPASRALYHPFPFDRPRLYAIFAYMVATRPFLKGMVRRGRSRTAVLLVARVGGSRRPIGYGNVAFHHVEGHPHAIFGYLVDERARGHGVGTRLHEVMIDEALRLGVTKGGGMVVVENTANVRILEKLGFLLTRSDIVDAGAPTSANYVSEGDLEAIARRIREGRVAPSGPDAGTPAPH